MPQIDLSTLGSSLGGLTLQTLLSAVITLLICLVAVRLLGKLMRRLLARTKLDERIQKYLLAGIKLILYIVTVLIVAESLNIPMTSLVALLSVGSLGVTLAAEDILGNVAGGLGIGPLITQTVTPLIEGLSNHWRLCGGFRDLRHGG